MTITRRNLLTSAGAGALAATLPLQAFARGDGMIDLIAAPSGQRLYGADGPLSDLWTYNGRAPGPQIRVTRGERVRVRFTNNLDEPTSVHWHGVRIDNRMDGVAGLTQDPVMPGGSFDYDFVAPDAGTYWYHAHNRSWNQVARGLYGPLIVDEANGPVFDPARDLTLVIDDWRLDRDGAFDVASLGAMMDWSHAGRLGNWLTVNGEAEPQLTLRAGQAHRLRLINAANARVLEIDPNRFGAKVLAHDGQALPEPVAPDYAPLLLGPAQRVDLLVVPEPGGDFALEELSGNAPFAFARFTVEGEASARAPVPRLPAPDLPEPDLSGARTIGVEMTGGAMGRMGRVTYNGKVLRRGDFRRTGQVWAFNGVANLPREPLANIPRGETVVIETVNDTAFAHAMHVHGHHFRVIERSGTDLDDGRPWRDTFLIGAQQTVRIAFVADNPGKWLYHCHMLEHAAAGMNTWFEVA
ncbi:multicopper oxidase family protein [Roseitalea porphyridii]|uniref:Multicopper oxidase family protein n=1 Tax=Roseitalea porphyridii TaxID=1852022 RepID=A0A4P6V501_9HYPH|nr:multicopper oxidase family protein [Roseitalea porphyridii]QBK31869.1 multicopper oxidase family protein [Roseitalea porphyridii]